MENDLTTQLITLCDMALIDRAGKLSIIGVFDVIHVTNFPGGIARAFFVATLFGKPNMDYELAISVENEKETLNTINLTIHTSPNGKNNMLFELVNLGFKEPGEYHFRIKHKEKVVGQFSLAVYQAQQPSQGAKLGVN